MQRSKPNNIVQFKKEAVQKNGQIAFFNNKNFSELNRFPSAFTRKIKKMSKEP